MLTAAFLASFACSVFASCLARLGDTLPVGSSVNGLGLLLVPDTFIGENAPLLLSPKTFSSTPSTSIGENFILALVGVTNLVLVAGAANV